MRRLNLPFVVVLILIFAVSLTAQTPQYYNFNDGTVSNSFPLNQPQGKMSQTVVPAATFINPSPAPAGNITKLYFRISSAYPLGPATYNTFKIMLLHVSSEFVTAGSFITGAWDTVFARDTITLSAGMNTWLEFTLDHPFAYNPAQPLAITMEQCGATGTTTGFSLRYTTATGNRRTYSGTTGCPHVYSGVSTNIINCGVDISSGPAPLCNKYSSLWCPANTLPSLPSAAYFTAASWVGDTLYVHTPTTTGAGATTIIRYVMGGTWTTGVPLPSALTGGSMTTCNGKLYFTGGGTSTVTAGTTICLEYNPSTGVWTTKAPMPAALSAHGSVCWGDSVIFVVGGPYTGSGTNLAVHYYRPASNTWGTITNSLPAGQGRRSHALGIVGNKIFMAAGYNTTFLNSFYIGTIGSDATSITWAVGPVVPQSLSRVGGVGYNHFFYVVGGEISGGGYGTNAHIYNIASNTWTTVAGKPTGTSNMWAGVTAKCVNDTVRVFVAGGYNAAAVSAFDYFGCGTGLVGIENHTTIPADYSLSQNYPNPFNPVTKINFTIPKSGFVTLKVFDLLGREVANLVNAEKSAGSYIVDFNASYLSSGVYFYKLEVNGFVDIKKMTLLK